MKRLYLLLACAGLTACSRAGYTGTVDEIHPARSSILIDLDGRYPHQKMTLYLPKETIFRIHGHWPAIGATITAKGEVTDYRGRPEIVIHDPSQLTW
jgi:DNA/RNA endonuclease YhcR with UshA esterase domain